MTDAVHSINNFGFEEHLIIDTEIQCILYFFK